jgi:hypothetical protein
MNTVNTQGEENMHQLQTILATVNGASFISIDTLTDVKLKGGQKNPFQGRVTKANVGSSVMVFQNKHTNAYENMVKRRLEQEGKDPRSFELSARKWGTRIPDTPFVEHNGNLYLEVIFLKAGRVDLLVDGMPYDQKKHGDIPGLPEDAPSEESQAGLENKVIVRTYLVNSIKRIRVNQQEYVL